MTIEKPMALSVNFDGIPNQLKKIPRWLLWRYVLVGSGENQKWSKLPMQQDGRAGSSTNPSTWTDFFTVMEAYQTPLPNNHFDGVGFVFSDEDNVVGIDLDDCYDINTNQFTNPESEALAHNIEGYMEVSPSGTGVKIFTLANLKTSYVDHTKGVEFYSRSRYFTVTGHHLAGNMPDREIDLTGHFPERTVQASGDLFADYQPPVPEWDVKRIETELLPFLAEDEYEGYHNWITVGMALHHQFSGDFEGLEVWDRWSQQSVKYDPKACADKWMTFGKRTGGATLRSLVYKVNQKKLQDALAVGTIVLDPASPYTTAKQFLEARFSTEDGYKLVHYASDFHTHKGTHYNPIEEATIRSELYKHLENCKKQDRKGNLTPFNATQANVTNIMDSVKALTHLEQAPDTKPPVWLASFAPNKPPAEKLVSMQNGLFHLGEDILLPHSLGFYNQHSLPFNYDPQATCPQWDKFLDDIWPNDPESKALLMEYIGYILSNDTKQQKFLSVIGPRRSGKGTINKILVALLGQNNVVSPQLEELCDTFALQSWLGKPLAAFTDARLTGKNAAGVVSQLLRIVGSDTITVNRKNKEAWSGYLPTRIIMYSNEALQLSENSNALTGRMLVLQMSNSFYGKEDVRLDEKLTTELAGIFNYAMRANKERLARAGEKFIQPESGRATLEMAAELGNPISSFVDEALVLDLDAKADKDDVFTVYKRWAHKKNLHPGTELSFKRRFIATLQDHGVKPYLDRTNGARQHVYMGVKLNEKALKYVESIKQFDDEEF